MREIVQKYTIYKYNELSEKIKEKLLEKEIDNCIDDYAEIQLEEDMKYKAKELLEKYFGQKAQFNKVYYDLSYCQGCGAMIDFYINYYNLDIHIQHCGRYSHQNSFEIKYLDYAYLNDKRENFLKEKVYDMNCEFTKFGYEMLEWENFIESAKENLEEYEFLENGEIFE